MTHRAQDLTGTIRWLCVGAVGTMPGRGRDIRTGYRKQPVQSVRVLATGLPGDGQAYRKHGGPDRVVLSYSLDNYEHWRATAGLDLPEFAAFGENFTTTGLTEFEVQIGDVFEAGDALLQVTQPRSPCSKIGARFGRPALTREVARSHRTGILYRVLHEGEVAAGDTMRLVRREGHGVTVARAHQVLADASDRRGAAELLAIRSLAAEARAELSTRTTGMSGEGEC